MKAKRSRTGDRARSTDAESSVEPTRSRYQSRGSDPTSMLHRRIGNQAVQELHEREATERVPRAASDASSDGGTLEATRSTSTDVSAIVRAGLDSPGRPLARDSHQAMAERFGRDFEHVRVHTGSRAAASAEALGAEAYTVGRHVVFGRGNYATHTESGRELLAHELTHVVQGRPAPGGRLTDVSDPRDPIEREAERVTRAVMRPEPGDAAPGDTGLAITTGYAPQVARQTTDDAEGKAALEAKVKKEAEELRKLKATLISTYGLAGIVDGDETWTLPHLKEVAAAFTHLPKRDKKALEHVVLKRVRSLGGTTAGRFEAEQGVEDTTVTRKFTLTLGNRAFSGTSAESQETIVHEVGHAVASMEVRTTSHEQFQATAKSNRLVGRSNAAVEAYNAAVDKLNETVEPYNRAAKAYNKARRSGNKQEIAEAKRTFEAAKKEHQAKKAEADRLKRIWTEAKAKTTKAEAAASKKEKTARKTRISDADLKRIRKQVSVAKASHDTKKAAADKKLAGLGAEEQTRASGYIAASQKAGKAIEDFADKTAKQDVAESQVEALVKATQTVVDERDSERKKLANAHAGNGALAILADVDAAQDAWFAAAMAHSLAHERSVRVQRFVEFVQKKGIRPRTIYPPDSYAEENWPHKPEEFYAEVYSMYVMRPADLKAKSKPLYDWFKKNKYH